tara:strand:+ start:132 stop:332 length:201 start_codon:yes stop_codon:yes gene_type:complete
MTSETMDITPTPRAVAIMCLEILKNTHKIDTPHDIEWAENQILEIIIEDWPDDKYSKAKRERWGDE